MQSCTGVQDLPRPIRRTYCLDSMLAHMLSRMLATLPRIEALSHMQADHHGGGFEAYLPLSFFQIHVRLQGAGINAEMCSYTAL